MNNFLEHACFIVYETISNKRTFFEDDDNKKTFYWCHF